MTRGALLVRDVVPADAKALIAIWTDFAADSKRPREETPEHQVEQALLRLETEPTERLIVAVVDDVPVGVAHLRHAPLSPIHDEDAVHVGYLHVLSGHRRRGIGKALLEAAADWADEEDAMHILASVAATARDSNRFLARLGLSQVAVVRASTVASLRCKLGASAKAKAATTNLIATRRLMRRRSATT